MPRKSSAVFVPLLIAGTLTGGLGCASPRPSWTMLLPIFRSARAELRASDSAHAAVPKKQTTATRAGPSAAALIENSLRARGLRFGTDGTVGALYAYTMERHEPVPASDAQPGDIVFFDPESDGTSCGTHAGIVESVDASGRISFREWRNGRVRRSVAHPAEPRARRDAAGRVVNSFLRPKRAEDPASVRYFAGEMLCAVARVKS